MQLRKEKRIPTHRIHPLAKNPLTLSKTRPVIPEKSLDNPKKPPHLSLLQNRMGILKKKRPLQPWFLPNTLQMPMTQAMQMETARHPGLTNQKLLASRATQSRLTQRHRL